MIRRISVLEHKISTYKSTTIRDPSAQVSIYRNHKMYRYRNFTKILSTYRNKVLHIEIIRLAARRLTTMLACDYDLKSERESLIEVTYLLVSYCKLKKV